MMIGDQIEQKRQLDKSDYPPKGIEQRAIKDLIIFRGNVADRPTNGDTEKQVFFAEDESKLYIWNRVNEAWESTTLS
jgi:hypothetical protein